MNPTGTEITDEFINNLSNYDGDTNIKFNVLAAIKKGQSKEEIGNILKKSTFGNQILNNLMSKRTNTVENTTSLPSQIQTNQQNVNITSQTVNPTTISDNSSWIDTALNVGKRILDSKTLGGVKSTAQGIISSENKLVEGVGQTLGLGEKAKGKGVVENIARGTLSAGAGVSGLVGIPQQLAVNTGVNAAINNSETAKNISEKIKGGLEKTVSSVSNSLGSDNASSLMDLISIGTNYKSLKGGVKEIVNPKLLNVKTSSDQLVKNILSDTTESSIKKSGITATIDPITLESYSAAEKGLSDTIKLTNDESLLSKLSSFLGKSNNGKVLTSSIKDYKDLYNEVKRQMDNAINIRNSLAKDSNNVIVFDKANKSANGIRDGLIQLANTLSSGTQTEATRTGFKIVKDFANKFQNEGLNTQDLIKLRQLYDDQMNVSKLLSSTTASENQTGKRLLDLRNQINTVIRQDDKVKKFDIEYSNRKAALDKIQSSMDKLEAKNTIKSQGEKGIIDSGINSISNLEISQPLKFLSKLSSSSDLKGIENVANNFESYIQGIKKGGISSTEKLKTTGILLNTAKTAINNYQNDKTEINKKKAEEASRYYNEYIKLTKNM